MYAFKLWCINVIDLLEKKHRKNMLKGLTRIDSLRYQYCSNNLSIFSRLKSILSRKISGTSYINSPIKVGDTASSSKVITTEDVLKFADLTLDTNPIHVNEEYAKRTMFKKPVVHGMFSLR